MSKETNKLRRVRIYKLSTFDTFTDEERALYEAYKRAGTMTKEGLASVSYVDENLTSQGVQ